METEKRVHCLYRLSTIGQVEKDDIPMQRQVCHEFVSCHPGWKIERELYEKGVSGFKKSAKDRDAIQELQKDAIQRNFDILLVYMFDRLGRRDDETPFVVEWFVQNGIEVWSAIEGQQRFENHVDKLLNYIRYWQASGESIKTSVRTKTRLSQLTEIGCYTGGGVPYGYKLEKRGRTNKKNQEVHDLVIDEDAAQIVRLIFYKYVHEGCGAQRISRFLMDMHIVRADGSDFPNTTIVRMLKNRAYTGVIQNGDAKSKHIPELEIIDQETFDRAQYLMNARTQQHKEVPLNLRGQSLLVGNVFCGHCKNRLTLTTSGRQRINKNGTVHYEARARYQCHYKVRHPDKCDGPSGYGLRKLDSIMEQVIHYQFSQISTASSNILIEEQHQKAIEITRARYRLACNQLSEKKRELADYQAEIIRVIRGESKLSAELLNDLIKKGKSETEALEKTVESTKQELVQQESGTSQETREYAQLQSWADLYDNCSFAAKKMIVSQFVKTVYVYQDYRLEVEFNVSFEDFKDLRIKCRNGPNEYAAIYQIENPSCCKMDILQNNINTEGLLDYAQGSDMEPIHQKPQRKEKCR